MIIESLASSVIVGKVRKGRIRNIEKVELKGWYMFLIAFGLEITANILKTVKLESISSFLDNYFIYIHTITYILLFIGIGMNYRKKSMWFVFVGTFLNFLVIILNGGHMPVWFEGLKIAGIIPKEAVQANFDLTHTLIVDTTRFTFLADIIPLPRPYPLPKLMSIGDLLLAMGVFIFIQEAMIIKED